MIFCLVWGMGGSFISLLLSKTLAKWSMGVKIIKPDQAGEYSDILRRVHTISKQAGLRKLPEVGIFESNEPNAFATGPSQSNSLVALSTGLIGRMSEQEVDAVIAHEVAHIKNGDMVTLTLLAGVVNAFTMFLARVIGFFISQSVKEESRSMVMMLTTLVLDIVLGLLGSLVVMKFSRYREFKADAGSAKILGTKQPMISALQSLAAVHGYFPPVENDRLAAFKISGKSGGFMRLRASHPPLEERIKAL